MAVWGFQFVVLAVAAVAIRFCPRKAFYRKAVQKAFQADRLYPVAEKWITSGVLDMFNCYFAPTSEVNGRLMSAGQFLMPVGHNER